MNHNLALEYFNAIHCSRVIPKVLSDGKEYTQEEVIKWLNATYNKSEDTRCSRSCMQRIAFQNINRIKNDLTKIENERIEQIQPIEGTDNGEILGNDETPINEAKRNKKVKD
jgi:hypothetical protein